MNEIMRFVAVGGLAALLNVLCRVGFNWLMPFESAVVLAYIFGMIAAYFLNRTMVFTSSGQPNAGQFGRFVLVNLVALVFVWVVSVGLLRVIFPLMDFKWHAETVAHAIGLASPIFSSYLLHRNYTFPP